MSLPPLADLLAVRRDDPREAEALARQLEGDPRFAEVWRPGGGWTVAVAPLPGGTPDPVAVRAAGVVYAEGREASGGGAREGAERAASLATTHPERLAELPGDVTLLAVGPGGDLTVTRSPGGLVPIYVSGAGDALATRITWLLPYLPRVEIDPVPTGLLAFGYPFALEGRTVLRDVLLLPRGDFARLTADGVRRGTFWDPRPERLGRPGPEQAREHVERLRAILLDRLATDLDPSGGNLLALSGGVDSTSMLCLAAGTLGMPTSAVSLMPAFPRALELEWGFIRSASVRGPIDRHWTFTNTATIRAEAARDAAGTGFPTTHGVLQRLPRIAAETEVRVLYGGEFGDEIGGSHFTLPDWVDQTSFPRVVANLGRLGHGPQDLLRWLKWRAQRLVRVPYLPLPAKTPGWLSAEVARGYRDALASFRSRILQDRRPRGMLELRASWDGFLPMNWETTAALGIRRSFPFFNREVLEFAFETHPSELVGPGLRKLTRAALAGEVPERNLGRVDKGQWGLPPEPPEVWAHPLPGALEGVVARGWHPRPVEPVDLGTHSRLWALARFAESLGLE